MITALIGWMIFGLIVGALGRYLVPGTQPMGLLGTMLLGVIGSYVGGFLAYLIAGGSALQSSGWIASIIGAVVVVLIGQYAARGGARSRL